MGQTGQMGSDLPTGVVTFLFTDIEASTKLAQRFAGDFPQILSEHFVVVRNRIVESSGIEVKSTGDGVMAAFTSPVAAVRAACGIQRDLFAHTWPEGGDVRVRIGIHTGEAELVDDDYVGLEVHRAARVMAAGHGGQTLVSATVRNMAADAFDFTSLGQHLLRGVENPVELFQVDVPDMPSDFPPVRSASSVRNNLPTRLSSVIGRNEDIVAIDALLRDNRLVTVIGPGGVGKTSLAVAVAARAIEQFRGGVVFVDLSAVSEPQFVIPSIADAIGISDKTVGGLVAALPETGLLLVMDNFEQVADAATDMAALLERVDSVRILATSQVPLKIPGERRYMLSPLAVNGSSDSAAVELFYERARAINPSFDSAPVEVAELVRRLDGLPLAIELVAARANVMSAAEMIDRLESGMAGYAAEVGADRHRSVDGALSWSYGLLDEPSATLFRRLSLFVGGARLTAAEEVAGGSDMPDMVGVVGDLVDRSLLVRSGGSSSRFGMLDGVRRFARSLLEESGEAERLQKRFTAHYVRLADDAYQGLQSDRGEWWRSLLDDELDNIREVLKLLHSAGDADSGLTIVGGTWRFYQSRGRIQEIDLWLSRFFDLPGSEGQTIGVVKGLMARAAIRYWQERPDDAVADYVDAVDRARILGEKEVLADALYGLGTSLIIAGSEDQAEAPLEEARHLYLVLDDPGGLADITVGETFIALNREGAAGLDAAFLEGAELYVKAGRHIQATQAYFGRSAVAITEGRFEDARRLTSDGLRRGAELGDLFLQTWGLEYMASVELEAGNLERSGLFIGAAERARTRIGGGWRPETVGIADARETLVSRLGAAGAAELIAPGEELSLEEAVALAVGPDSPGETSPP